MCLCTYSHCLTNTEYIYKPKIIYNWNWKINLSLVRTLRGSNESKRVLNYAIFQKVTKRLKDFEIQPYRQALEDTLCLDFSNLYCR